MATVEPITPSPYEELKRPDAPTHPLTANTLDALKQVSASTQIFFFGSAEYEAARTKGPAGLNHPDWPACIAQPKDSTGLSNLLQCAKKYAVPLCIKSGGHSSISMTKPLVIDMRFFSSVEVDAVADPPTVKCGGGTLSKEIDAACAPHGIAVILGNAYTVGAVSPW